MDRIHPFGKTEEPINANGKKRKWSDVWAHFEEVEISSKNSDGVPIKVVKIRCKGCKQCFTKSKGGTTSTLKRHIKERCPHTHLREIHPLGKTEEPNNGNGKKRKWSDVWAHFEEVEISSKNSDGEPIKVVKIKCKGCKQCFTKSKGGPTSTLKRHIKERCLHTHLRVSSSTTTVPNMVSSHNEETVRLEVSDTNKTAEKGATRKRSVVWTQFEEVVVTEKKQKGLNFKVKKLQCKKCKRLFTKSKDGPTSSLKRHVEETCVIRNGQRSLLDYCIGS